MSAETNCYRMSGGGNDFLALVEPEGAPSAALVRAWCTRGLSLGADGLFTLSRGPNGLRMRHYNADGKPASLCLNGTRCAVRLAAHLGWHAGETTVETDAGSIAGTLDGERVVLRVPPPTGPPDRRALSVDGTAYDGWFVTVGVPQFVLPWGSSLAQAPVADLGPRLRRHPDLGPAGANVMFVRFLPPSRIEIRSYERGVEGETLACGTGVLAAAAVAANQALLEFPVTALTGGGCEFEVDVQRDGAAIAGWSLAGDARLVARVEPLSEAQRLPRPPAWT